MATSKPLHRFRFRFGLWTFFVVMTVVSLVTWLGHHLHWIWQRREFIAACAQDEFITVESMSEPERQCETIIRGSLPIAPGMLRFVDEPAVFMIFVDSRDSVRTQVAKRLFPEAVYIGPGVGSGGIECLIE